MRRSFIKTIALAAAGTAVLGAPASATAGERAAAIGAGYTGHCGNVTIGGTVYYDGAAFQNGGETFLATSPLVYQP